MSYTAAQLVIAYYNFMPRPVLTLRLPEQVFAALVRERRERHLNVSGWARAAVLDAFQRDFPNAVQSGGKPTKRDETQNAGSDINTPSSSTAPIPGWKPCRLDDGWGSALSGPAVDSLPKDLVGALIAVTDRSGSSWTATITAVAERSHDRVVVTDSGRPR